MTEDLRITVQVDPAVERRLYEELMRYPKGPRRARRLLALARDGLATQNQAVILPDTPIAADVEQADIDGKQRAAIDAFGVGS